MTRPPPLSEKIRFPTMARAPQACNAGARIVDCWDEEARRIRDRCGFGTYLPAFECYLERLIKPRWGRGWGALGFGRYLPCSDWNSVGKLPIIYGCRVNGNIQGHILPNLACATTLLVRVRVFSERSHVYSGVILFFFLASYHHSRYKRRHGA